MAYERYDDLLFRLCGLGPDTIDFRFRFSAESKLPFAVDLYLQQHRLIMIQRSGDRDRRCRHLANMITSAANVWINQQKYQALTTHT